MNGFTENDDVLYQVQLAEQFGLHPHEISKDSQKLARFMEVADFFKPYEDSGSIISRLVTRVPKDQVIDHVWRYVGLHKQKQTAEKTLADLNANLALYERIS